jgi:Trypsin
MKPIVPSLPLLGIFVVTLITGCSSQDIAPNDTLLIGGSPVIDETDFPATVGISMKGRLCTGSKIGPRQILTAGHCVEDDHGKKLVPDGEDFGIFTYNVQSVPPDRTHSERRIRTEKIVTHPRFRSPNPGPDDIAIIFTAEDISWIPEARLEFNTTSVGTPVTVAGYGCEEGRNISPTTSPRLKSASAATVSPTEAQEDLKQQPWFNLGERLWYDRCSNPKPCISCGDPPQALRPPFALATLVDHCFLTKITARIRQLSVSLLSAQTVVAISHGGRFSCESTATQAGSSR